MPLAPHAAFPNTFFPHLYIVTSACPSKKSWLKSVSPFPLCFLNTWGEAVVRVKRNPWNQFPKAGGEMVPLKWLPTEEFPEEGGGQPWWQVLGHCHYQLCPWGNFAEAAQWLKLVPAPVPCCVYLKNPLPCQLITCGKFSENYIHGKASFTTVKGHRMDLYSPNLSIWENWSHPELLTITELALRCWVLATHLSFSDVCECKKHFRDIKMENWFSNCHFKFSHK